MPTVALHMGFKTLPRAVNSGGGKKQKANKAFFFADFVGKELRGVTPKRNGRGIARKGRKSLRKQYVQFGSLLVSLLCSLASLSVQSLFS